MAINAQGAPFGSISAAAAAELRQSVANLLLGLTAAAEGELSLLDNASDQEAADALLRLGDLEIVVHERLSALLGQAWGRLAARLEEAGIPQ